MTWLQITLLKNDQKENSNDFYCNQESLFLSNKKTFLFSVFILMLVISFCQGFLILSFYMLQVLCASSCLK